MPRVLKLHAPTFWDALGQALKEADPTDTIYVSLPDRDAISHEDLAELGKLFTTVGQEAPQLNVVPLLPALWPSGKLQELGIAAHTPQQQPTTAEPSSPSSSIPAVPPPPAPALHSNSNHIVGPSQQLKFKAVAVGGTFDRLHAGHRLLLAATALVASERVYIGVTDAGLLATKKARELLQSYEQREAAAMGYVSLVHPKLHVAAGALKDPNEPTLAETDPDMEAIVVSEETLIGAQAINHGRAKLGYKPLHIVVVSLVWPRSSRAKLSSTDLRLQDMAAAAGQQKAA